MNIKKLNENVVVFLGFTEVQESWYCAYSGNVEYIKYETLKKLINEYKGLIPADKLALKTLTIDVNGKTSLPFKELTEEELNKGLYPPVQFTPKSYLEVKVAKPKNVVEFDFD